jgi:hypothetical protein
MEALKNAFRHGMTLRRYARRDLALLRKEAWKRAFKA